VRVLIDYRPALRERSGVGEYTHELTRALLAGLPANGGGPAVDLTLFSSSWADRFEPGAELAGATAIDRRVPVRLLNFAWHRLEWPPAETLTGRAFDVSHSLHPLLLPARNAAQVVTIHDLHFVSHPERTRAEIRRDYPSLARSHAHRADRVVVVSEFTRREVERHFGLPADRMSICPPGAPSWAPRAQPPPDGGYVLFFGTLEPRKNVGGLLDAYERLASRRRDLPPLVLAGRETADARPWLDRLARPPLDRLVRHIGYVEPASRRALYEGARLLVQPSFEEGFGIPVLEAMTLGVPVVVANRGALPELVGDAALLVDPDDRDELAGAIERVLDDQAWAAEGVAKGLARAREYSWTRTARRMVEAYGLAIDRRRERTGSGRR
jgi:glycosyltransferase involved in cell wall biosynthesis